MKKMLFVLSILLSGCGSDYMYNHNSSNIDEAIKGTTDHTQTWQGMGFTKEEYRLYSSVGMTPTEANFWKKADIYTLKEIQTFPEWKSLDVSSSYAAYFIKNANATPDRFREASQAFETFPEYSNQQSMTEVLQKMQSGMTAENAVSNVVGNIVKNQKKEQAKIEKNKFSSDILKICNKTPQSIYQYTISKDTKNPYTFKGECYILNTPIDTVKWMSDHQVLIVAMSAIDASNIIYIYDNKPIKLSSLPIVIGTEPETFNNALGGENTFPSFRVIGYEQN